MPYIGRPLLAGSYNKLDNIIISSPTDTFALTKGTAAFTPATAEQLIVSVNGVTQAPRDAYSVSGSNIIFTENLTTSDTIDYIVSLGEVGNSVVPTDGSVTGGGAVTFSTGGATIVVGEVDTVGTVGGVGGVNSDWVDLATVGGTASTDIAVTSGDGLTLSTAMGGATLTIGYVADATQNGEYALTGSTSTAAGATISMPMGGMTATVGFANADTATESETHVGGSVSLAAGGGTLTVGMGQASLAAGTATSMGATYAMSLDADTSLSVGYNNTKDAALNSTTTELNLSRALGGGTSVFLDVENVSGSGTAGTAFAIGSTFAF